MTTEIEDRLRRLLDVGETLVSELDPDLVLERILQEAQRLTGARYAALGVLDEERRELDRFVTAGIDRTTHHNIGELPRGRGVLGVLIADPRPLRLTNVGAHPESYGFPPAHPMMRSFLGVPIVIRGQGWGNLYLTEKEGGGEFTANDEEALSALAGLVGVAVENARRYTRSEHRRDELEQVVATLEATNQISRGRRRDRPRRRARADREARADADPGAHDADRPEAGPGLHRRRRRGRPRRGAGRRADTRRGGDRRSPRAHRPQRAHGPTRSAARASRSTDG